MGRILFIYFLFFVADFNFAQTVYPSSKIKLLSVSNPNKDSTLLTGAKYSGCWGWYQENKNKEYALIGGTNGTYFIDITNPHTPIVCDYVAAKTNCIWREIKNYKNYCYVVTECGNGLQIIDMKYLPDSVHVISTGTNVLTNSHTIWIEGNKLYCASLKMGLGNYSAVGVFSLLNPETPFFLRSINTDYNSIGAHDVYVRNDTLYVSDPGAGIQVLKYDTVSNKFYMLGAYLSYDKKGYNHSSFLTQNGKYLVFCDEIPEAVPIHLVDVNNLNNILPVSSFLPYPLTIPHNPYILGNDWAIISCYQDGMHIYDISDPVNVKHVGFFDTYFQAGFNQGAYSQGYIGNWGVYPFLPSKTIIANDMMNGAFFLDASEVYATKSTTVATQSEIINDCALIYTIPASKYIQIKVKAQVEGKIQICDPNGKIVFSKRYTDELNEKVNTENFPNGLYVISIGGTECKVIKKILITHFE